MQPLNGNAEQILASATAPSDKWFNRFYHKDGPYAHLDKVDLQEMLVVTADRKRDSACTYSAAKDHLEKLMHELMCPQVRRA